MTPNHTKILYAINALCILALLAFFFFYIYESRQASLTEPVSNATAQTTAPTTDEANLPHFPNGNIDGKITGVQGNTITAAVILPGATTVSNVTATITVDSGTQIYKVGADKDPAVYQDEINKYIKGGSVGAAPDPYSHVALKISDLAVGVVINVLPKPGSVKGTSLTAQVIMPLNATPAPQPAASSTPH